MVPQSSGGAKLAVGDSGVLLCIAEYKLQMKSATEKCPNLFGRHGRISATQHCMGSEVSRFGLDTR